MNIYKIIKEHLEAGGSGVLATVINRTGSAPRDAGAKMFVAADGSSYGTVGGGALEYEVLREADAEKEIKKAVIIHVRMDAKTVADEGMICGGNVDVLLEPVSDKYLDLYSRLAIMEDRGGRGVVITGLEDVVFKKTLIEDTLDITGDLVDEARAQQCLQFVAGGIPVVSPDRTFIIEPVVPRLPLYVFGAGHISRYIVKMAKMVDFYVVVADDRKEFANDERFPDADEIMVGDLAGVFSSLTFTGNEYVVIVTRGHSHDADVLKEALSKDTKYIGMIGSKRKVKMIFDLMKQHGFDESAISRVYAPIGLSINAETPQEIAVSIVAQLIQIRRG